MINLLWVLVFAFRTRTVLLISISVLFHCLLFTFDYKLDIIELVLTAVPTQIAFKVVLRILFFQHLVFRLIDQLGITFLVEHVLTHH